MATEPNDKLPQGTDELSGENVEIQLDESDAPASGTNQLERLQQELTEANERVLRGQAELENFRRRMRRERDEDRQYAFQPLLNDLLPVIDNIDRAIEAAEGADESAGLLAGFKMVAQSLHDVLQQHHCLEIKADGTPFDPTLHEALAQQPTNDVPAGTVVGVHQKGYRLRDRVIRPAQVIVSKEIE